MDSAFQSPATLSFCTGIRGLERGLEKAIGPCRVAAYVEVEAFCAWNLVAQMEAGLLDTAPVFTDLKAFPSKYFRNKIHGIIGGYPCQPFSLAGKRQGETDPRHLWPYISKAIKSINPVWCFFENVDDHLSMGFDTVYKDLHSMGYKVEAGIFSADEVGAPQERKRLFSLAIQMGYAKSRTFKQSSGHRRLQPQLTEVGHTSILPDTNGTNGAQQEIKRQLAKQHKAR